MSLTVHFDTFQVQKKNADVAGGIWCNKKEDHCEASVLPSHCEASVLCKTAYFSILTHSGLAIMYSSKVQCAPDCPHNGAARAPRAINMHFSHPVFQPCTSKVQKKTPTWRAEFGVIKKKITAKHVCCRHTAKHVC